MPVQLHLGLGAFHRAHQAVYLQRLADAGDTSWSLCAGNLRPDGEALLDQLRAQGSAYTLETVTPAGDRQYERISSLKEVLPWDEQLTSIISRGADPDTRIVSFTVTEGGYALSPSGTLDTAHPDVVAALAGVRRGLPGTTWHGAMVCLLRERVRRGAGPVTLLCCDNLRHNGDRSRAALLAFIVLLGDTALRDWVEANTTSPNCMVDRITPRPTPDVVERVRTATGADDPCALMAENFLQWVVEDRFAAGRPAWERVGVETTTDVQPYEEAKIRLLNATHSCVAWGGVLAGHAFIHEGMRDPRVRALALAYTEDGAIPLLQGNPLDLPANRDTVLDRFGNAAIRDTSQRVVSHSFAKIPAFFAPSVRGCIARGRPLPPLALPAALFLAFLQKWDRRQLPFEYEDNAMDEGAARAICRSSHPAAALASARALWGDAAGHPAWTAALATAHGQVLATFD